MRANVRTVETHTQKNLIRMSTRASDSFFSKYFFRSVSRSAESRQRMTRRHRRKLGQIAELRRRIPTIHHVHSNIMWQRSAQDPMLVHMLQNVRMRLQAQDLDAAAASRTLSELLNQCIRTLRRVSQFIQQFSLAQAQDACISHAVVRGAPD